METQTLVYILLGTVIQQIQNGEYNYSCFNGQFDSQIKIIESYQSIINRRDRLLISNQTFWYIAEANKPAQ